jgi:flagellar biosynthesis/type III secretory pathway M-ring protein FliF/YscJ
VGRMMLIDTKFRKGDKVKLSKILFATDAQRIGEELTIKDTPYKITSSGEWYEVEEYRCGFRSDQLELVDFNWDK